MWIAPVLLFACVGHCAAQKAWEIFPHSEHGGLSVTWHSIFRLHPNIDSDLAMENFSWLNCNGSGIILHNVACISCDKNGSTAIETGWQLRLDGCRLSISGCLTQVKSRCVCKPFL